MFSKASDESLRGNTKRGHCTYQKIPLFVFHGGDKKRKRCSKMCDTAWYVLFPSLDGLRNAKPIVTIPVDSHTMEAGHRMDELAELEQGTRNLILSHELCDSKSQGTANGNSRVSLNEGSADDFEFSPGLVVD